jgi:cytochrome c553
MTIRITWRRAALTLAGLALAGLLFAWSGLFNVAASTGHWRISDVVVHWVMRNSVRTHAWLEGAPERVRDDSGLVSAAGQFAQACASCHGAPGVKPLPAMQGATPAAPHLPDHLHEWTDAKLFWIIKHGVKLTGMPAWAGQDRPDEIARMVAFVRRLETMTPAEYQALTGAAGAVPAIAQVRPAIAANCVSCHGADGLGRGQRDIPILAGQRPDALRRALADYAKGTRSSGVMAQAAAVLTPGEMSSLAAYFAARPGLGATPAGDAKARQLVERGIPQAQLPACASCHGANGRAPRLAGQKATYIAQRLRQWRGDEAEVDARKPQDVMAVIARRIPEERIDALANYLSGGR